MQKLPTHAKILATFFVLYTGACLYTLVTYDLATEVLTRMFWCWLASLAVMSALFLVSRKLRRVDVVDVGWGLSFVAIAVTGYFLGGGHQVPFSTKTLVLVLVLVWALRLATHIGRRLLKSKSEDPRYTELRSRWKSQSGLQTFIRIFVVQSFLSLLVSIPIIHIHLLQEPEWSWLAVVGLAIWVIGFVIEVVADHQLATFVANPANKGKLMTKGLWSLSRHPNYFGELVMWWGVAVVCLGTPHGWVGLGGAVAITYLIVFVSGLPPAEKRASTKPGWEEYKRTTSILIPAKPKV